jgi:hypothetical protein
MYNWPGRESMMKSSRMLERFSSDESGAVTVDRVVLTAAILGLGLIVLGGRVPELVEI